MKKILPASLVVLVLAAAGASVYLFEKPKLDARAASAAAGYLPADTLLLLALPDPGQTVQDWKTTDLYKIWTEPQVQAFLAKPLTKIPPDKELNDTLAQIGRLDPKNLFVAVTSLDDKNNQPHLIAGFQFAGASADVDKLLARPQDALRQRFPAGKADLINYQGRSIKTFATTDGDTLASVFVDQTYLVGNDLALLKATVDRIDHHAPAGDATLEKSADFQAVSAKLPKNHATLVFARPQVFFAKIFALAAASGQAIDPAQRAEVDKIKAFGASTSIDQGKLRDTLYVLAPGYKREQPLGYGALALSSADTIFYTASLLNLPEKLNLAGLPAGSDASAASGVPGAATAYAMLGQLFKEWQQQGLTYEGFHAAFGRELSLLLDWPANTQQPALLASLDVRDPAAAGKFVDGFTKSLSGAGDWQTTQDNGATLHTLKFPTVPFVSPTFTLTARHLVLGLSASGVKSAVGREKSGGANFTTGEAYKTSVATVAKGDVGFGYLDTRMGFERLYGALKPMAVMGLMFYPQTSDYVDIGKLPDTETISRHLSPIVLSQSADDQGVLMESVGPVTFMQAGVGLVGGGAATAIPFAKSMGAFTHPGGTSEDPAETPDETPESTP